jgi:uncharacterized Zn-binding protein involved in type VI secretion
MGKPAARLGDMTAHGGSIVVGLPTVLIGGMPAARVGDMHVCPMLNPGTPPPPHVGGPIMMGSPMVLIGGMPAARMGDMVTCAGPPDTIMLGCMTVLIGEGGSGSASGGGSGSTAVASAVASVATALTDNNESFTKHEHWVEFAFVDKAGKPISGVSYKFTGSDKKSSESVLRPDGRITRDAMPSGQCKVQLFHVSNAKWSKNKANVGEKVKMSADVEGYDNGTPAVFEIYEHDLKGADVRVATFEAEVQGTKVEGEWEYVYEESKGESSSRSTAPQGYSNPEYYFEVLVGRSKTRSGLLGYQDWIEIELKDENGKAVGNEEYVLYFPNGEVRQGRLDGSGKKREEKIPPGTYDVRFPKLPESMKRK